MNQKIIQPYIPKEEVFNSKVGIFATLKHISPLFNSYKITGFNPFSSINLAIKLQKFNNKEKVDDKKVYELLKRFKKMSHLENDLLDYSINKGAGFGYGYYKGRAIFRDANYQFILKCQDELSAVLGFEPCRNAILISQIQGVKGNQDALKPIKWPNILVNIALDFAKDANISEVYLLPHKRNCWPKVVNNVNNAEFYYDITAKKEGFKYDSEKEVYVKKLL